MFQILDISSHFAERNNKYYHKWYQSRELELFFYILMSYYKIQLTLTVSGQFESQCQ